MGLRLPEFREIQVRDLRDSSPFLQVILEPLNQMIQYLKQAFNGNIGASNLSIQTIMLRIEAPFQETRIAKDKPDSVYTVQVAQILDQDGNPLTGQSGVLWYEDGNSIVITDILGLVVSVVYNIKLMALYE